MMAVTERMCAAYKRNLKILAGVFAMIYASAAWAQATTVPIYALHVPGFNVPLTVLAMSLAGSFVGIAYAPPLESRRKLYFYALANALIGAWCVVLIPEWRGWHISDIAQPPLAGVLSATAIFWVPVVLNGLPALARKIMQLLGKVAEDRATKEGEK